MLADIYMSSISFSLSISLHFGSTVTLKSGCRFEDIMEAG